jgi:hypothetical protein
MPIPKIETHTNKKASSPQQHRPGTRPPAPAHPAAIIQRARAAPESLSAADVLQLQHTIGNRAVGQLLTGIGRLPSTSQQAPVQRQGPEEEEELMQGKFESIQRQTELEEEELLQGKFDAIQRQGLEEEELLQGKSANECIQCQAPEEEEELMQAKFSPELTSTIQAKPDTSQNQTGIPDHLKSGLEILSGLDLSSIRVHSNSSRPAKINALAYTQGKDIHVAPGQEKHIPHEGWHVVQQMQGRVKPTIQVRDLAINDDQGLEREADAMARRASVVGYEAGTQPAGSGIQRKSLKEEIQLKSLEREQNPHTKFNSESSASPVIQRLVGFEVELSIPTMGPAPAAVNAGFSRGPKGGFLWMGGRRDCTTDIEQFLTKGLEYGREDLGNNPDFRLTADHNVLARKSRAIFTKLHGMGYAPAPFGKTISNLEYATEAIDELAPHSTLAFNRKFMAIAQHADSLFPNVKDNIIQVPNTGGNIYAGIPVNSFQRWLRGRYGDLRPKIQDFQQSIHNRLYIQATAGIIPSALPELYQRHITPSNVVLQDAAIEIDHYVQTLMNHDAVRDHPYIQNLRDNEPISYDAFVGILYLVFSYLVGVALNQTNAFGGTSKNAVPFLSQMNLGGVMGEATAYLYHNEPPDDLIAIIDPLLRGTQAVDPDYWADAYNLQRRPETEKRWVVDDPSTLIRRVLKGEDVETISPQEFGPDELPEAVETASEEQSGIPLEYRYISRRPTPGQLNDTLMEIVNDVRALNTKHLGDVESQQIIDNANS